MPDHVHLLLKPLPIAHGRPDTLVGQGNSRNLDRDAMRDRSVPPTIAGEVVYYDLANIMKGIKGSSSRRINQILGSKGKVWQPEYFDRIMRDEDEFLEKLNYIYNNPIKSGLVDNPDEYEFYIFPK